MTRPNVDNGMRDVAEPGTIIRAIVGSTLHGLNVAGTDDRDEMGVCVEPPAYAIGLHQFEQWVFRTQPDGAPSGPGDLDLTIYSLRKYLRLALAGNPSVLLLLFAPDAMCTIVRTEGHALQALAGAIVSRACAGPFLGYLTAQRQRLVGERGGRALREQDKWGGPKPGPYYDTKYAMHMVRLGFQGVELLMTGRITLPMPKEERAFTMAVRLGDVPLNDVLTKTGELEQRLTDLRDTSPLPERPDKDVVEEWMLRTYLRDPRWL